MMGESYLHSDTLFKPELQTRIMILMGNNIKIKSIRPLLLKREEQ